MMVKKEILLVEDDVDLATVVASYLRLNGFSVHHTVSAEAALHHFQKHSEQIALLLIDVQLPLMNGFELAKRITEISKEQIFLFLTAKHTKEDRLKGLSVGAIDYIIKPFEIDELVLRINNLLERLNSKTLPASKFSIGDMTYHPERLCLETNAGLELILTLRESEVLLMLLRKSNQVVSKKELLLDIWNNDDYFNGKSLEVIISRLRTLLKNSNTVSIETRYGVGYMLKAKSSQGG